MYIQCIYQRGIFNLIHSQAIATQKQNDLWAYFYPTDPIFTALYNNMISVCIFIHRWREILVSRLVSLFPCPKNPSINHLNFYCTTHYIYKITFFHVCVLTNRSQKKSQRVKNNRHATLLRLVPFCSITVHTPGKMLSICLSSGVLKNWVMDSNFLS